MFQKKLQIKEYKNRFWRNTYWTTEDDDTYLVEITDRKENTVSVVFN